MHRRIVKIGLGILFLAALATVAGLRHGTQASDSKNSAMPPASIPTFSMDNVGREGFFFVGGKYEGAPGKEVMHGTDVRRSDGAQADQAEVSDRIFPRKRAGRHGLETNAGRAAGLGVLPD